MSAKGDVPVCLVTGASSGIGRVTALGMAEAGFHVIGVGRDPRQLAETEGGIAAAAGPDRVTTIRTDLSDPAEVRHLAELVRGRHDRLDVLINNAGVIQQERRRSTGGVELTWAVNYLAPFLLTNLLLDLLKSSGPSRIVNVGSAVQALGRLDLDDPQYEHRRYRAMAAYAQSKLALLMFTFELAARLEGTAVTANCVHPGGARSNLARTARSASRLVSALVLPVLPSTERAAEATVFLATSTAAAGLTGGYFINRRPPRPGRANPLAGDTEARRRLWDLSCRMTGLADQA